MVEHLDKVFQTIERWIRRHVTALFLAACGMLWLALRFPGNTHAMAVAMPCVRENDTPGVLRECSGRLRSYYRQNVTQIWTVYNWTCMNLLHFQYFSIDEFMKMNTPASLVILLPVWLCICTCPACPADRTEPYYQSFTTCKAWKLRSHAPSSFYTFYTFYTDSTRILHHVSVLSGCQGLSIFGRSRPEGKTTWGGRDSCDIMRWRPRTAERNDNERAIQCRPTAERNDNDSGIQWNTATETEVGLEVTWSG